MHQAQRGFQLLAAGDHIDAQRFEQTESFGHHIISPFSWLRLTMVFARPWRAESPVRVKIFFIIPVVWQVTWPREFNLCRPKGEGVMSIGWTHAGQNPLASVSTFGKTPVARSAATLL